MMLREIQIHFENQGVLNMKEDIPDVAVWFNNIMQQNFFVAKDKETGRDFLMQMRTVTAIIVDEKKIDLFDRTYASE
jgi:hypothetical protein